MKRINITDKIIILIIGLSPSLFYLYRLFPDSYLIRNVDFFGFIIDFDTVLWIFVVKLNLIVLLLIWYFTCKHWWKISLLVPLAIEFFKLISFLNPNIKIYDEVDYITSIPFTFPVIFLIILLSIKLRLYLKSAIINEELNSEINKIFKEITIKNESLRVKLEEEFEDLKRNKSKYKKDAYLKKMLTLRSKIY